MTERVALASMVTLPPGDGVDQDDARLDDTDRRRADRGYKAYWVVRDGHGSISDLDLG